MAFTPAQVLDMVGALWTTKIYISRSHLRAVIVEYPRQWEALHGRHTVLGPKFEERVAKATLKYVDQLLGAASPPVAVPVASPVAAPVPSTQTERGTQSRTVPHHAPHFDPRSAPRNAPQNTSQGVSSRNSGKPFGRSDKF